MLRVKPERGVLGIIDTFLSICRAKNPKVSIKKPTFVPKSVPLCGRIIDEDGVHKRSQGGRATKRCRRTTRICTLYEMDGKQYPRLSGTSRIADGGPRGSVAQGLGTNQEVDTENVAGIAGFERHSYREIYRIPTTFLERCEARIPKYGQRPTHLH